MANERPLGAGRIAWLDVLKGFAILWIIWNHVAERIWGGPYFANPYAGWPPLAERLTQAAPLPIHDVAGVIANGARWIGWLGDQGVQLFLIASGFGLVWGLLNRPRPLDRSFLSWFYRRRLARLYPTWWMAHALVAIPAFVLGWGILALDSRMLLSLLGLRITPGTFYYLFPAWWFIGLILQLYAVFPLLWYLQRRWGSVGFLAAAILVGVASRLAGMMVLEGALSPWLRGLCFVTRLPEFAVGMAFAVAWHAHRDRVESWLRAGWLPAALLLYALANALSFTYLGNAVSPLLTGIGAFWLFMIIAPSRRAGEAAALERPLVWSGIHSYSVFLVHHPLILLLMPNEQLNWPTLILSLALIVPVALLLEKLTDAATRLVTRWRERGGWLLTAGNAALIGATVAATIVGAEWLVRRFDPQEILGWGERVSLQPDDELGYRMRASETFRLRWQGYDYVVHTNALGFPAPHYPEEKEPGVYRVLTLGDAFTSAEGVDTERAWPRQLEQDLNAHAAGDRRYEVLNFGVTGYGPQHYALLAERYVPRYHPDLVVVGFFVNDFDDVTRTMDRFTRGIGFDKAPQTGWRSYRRPYHLREWFDYWVVAPVRERLLGVPRHLGSLWGQLEQFETDNLRLDDPRVAAVKEDLARVDRAASAEGASVLLMLIPASVQVCDPGELPYLPRIVDLADTTRYDLNRPQRLASEVAAELGIPCWDLRSVLRASDGVRYYPKRNMHWTEAAHQVVAEALAQKVLGQDGGGARGVTLDTGAAASGTP
jgi:peptidoglycan/LPS O-acetylase OafA/YrhL